MADEIIVTRPAITAVQLSVNPVAVGGTTKLSITVVEQQIVLQPLPAFSGEVYSNEI